MFREYIETILVKLDIKKPPVDLDKVASFFNIKIVKYPNFPDNVSGTIVKRDDKTYIGVNERHAVVRQRFTIAHELGHYFLGHDENEMIDYSFDKDSHKEREANKFASELLMPMKLLSEDIENLNNISELAKKYQVSEQSMSIRLLETKLINKIKI